MSIEKSFRVILHEFHPGWIPSGGIPTTPIYLCMYLGSLLDQEIENILYFNIVY